MKERRESDTTTLSFRRRFFLFEYLGEIETESESVLTCLSEDWMSSNHEKNNGKIFLVTLPLKGQVIAVK